MGLLEAGTPMEWEEAKKYACHVRENGLQQFLALYHKHVGQKDVLLRWGDEVEYFVCRMCPVDEIAWLPLRAHEILAGLHEFAESLPHTNCAKSITWHPEYAQWMLEGTPGQPYREQAEDLLEVEKNMVLRRQCIQKFLKQGENILTLPVFPLIGAPYFVRPKLEPNPEGPVSRSAYIPDEAINPHPRFATLTANIRKRRGEKVCISVPIYKDENTAATLAKQREDLVQRLGEEAIEGLPLDSIYMDCMAFGMGAGCLQMTFQATDIDDARFLYDQLAIIAPYMLALTAASPIWKGMLADTDVRWDVISASVDDRPKGERGEAAREEGERLIPKSRYSSIDCFISTSPLCKDQFNDVECVVDEKSLELLLKEGIDRRLANHVAHLFIRDPLVVFREKLEQDNTTANDHFENLQSTNWNTVRFKVPPAAQDNIQWRVEFRSMELNLTDFENAAHTVFVMLLTRAISSEGLNFYMPISFVDTNMKRAHSRNAIKNEKFWMRRNKFCEAGNCEADPDLAEMTLGEIINGDGQGFLGLNHCIRKHLDMIECLGPTRAHIERYLEFIGKRASGELLSTAEWMRQYVLAHPQYAKDSAVTEKINYDLLKTCLDVSHGDLEAPELLGGFACAASRKLTMRPPPCGAAAVTNTN
eukprot:CAMPEP_0181298976 /NCGR_PEP_ID=MMETSP1101-20121128/6080_1 /TAXON_ID=46948 /ORGANISM="Rhodomonas abbreviata, Strain Caron Lab Isolate" /LENGTH=645 /DNA_ID=CAMNT_0023404055 /DNA_START=87 /DNA_END=2024 /DNA_ORIENTATION=+